MLSPALIGCFILAALALFAWAVLRVTRWGPAAGWSALALIGQLSSFQLLDVGPRIKLQLFHRWETLLGTPRVVFLLFLAAQAACVLWAVRRDWPTIRDRLARLFTERQLLIFLTLTAYSAITVATVFVQSFWAGGFREQIVRHAGYLLLALCVSAIGALNLFLAVRSLPDDGVQRAAAWWNGSSRRRLPRVCALWVLAVAALLGWFVLDGMPHVPDEVAYLFQAQYMAAGRFYLPPPPHPNAFWCYFCFVDGGKWYGIFPPGWPAALALGVWAGVPWLINPLLGAVAVLLAHALVRKLYDKNVADAAVLLLAVSPWFLFMSASLMAHPLGLVCMLAGLLGVAHAREAGHWGWAVLAGLSFGFLLHVRPYEAVSLALAAGLWWLSAGWHKLRLASLLATAAAGAPFAGLALLYNKLLTGDARLTPILKFFDQTTYPGSNRLGFGPNIANFGWTGLDALPGHGPIDVLMNTNHNLYMIQFEMFGWVCGSLLFVLLLLVWRGVRRDGLMFGILGITWAAMSLYWFSGVPDFGARYWYPVIVPLAVLTVRGISAAAERLEELGRKPALERVWAFAVLATLVGLPGVMVWRSLDKYPDYRGLRADVRQLEKQHNFGRSLVFVRGERWPDYSSAFPFNPPALGSSASGPIYAWDAGPEARRRVIAAYQDRPVWLVEGPSVTRDGFRVVMGPLPAGTDPPPAPEE
jgi:4-amino-4-deoxy-L-arabinose transferase-like glycosyltransferase